MRREEHIDYHLVPDHHLEIHRQLEQWASWVKVRPHGWQTAPMWRQAQSNSRQWHAPELRAQPNIPDAVAMEKAVALLPEKHREAIRWCYVFSSSGPLTVSRRLAVTKQGLLDLIHSARAMLKNRM